MTKLLFPLFIFILLTAACKKNTGDSGTGDPIIKDPSTIFEMKVPNGFTYQSSVELDLKIRVLNAQNLPGKNVILTLHSNTIENGGELLYKGRADASGLVNTKIKVPASLKNIVCNTSLLGIPENILSAVQAGVQSINLGGSKPQLVKTVGSNQTFLENNLHTAVFTHRQGYYILLTGFWHLLFYGR